MAYIVTGQKEKARVVEQKRREGKYEGRELKSDFSLPSQPKAQKSFVQKLKEQKQLHRRTPLLLVPQIPEHEFALCFQNLRRFLSTAVIVKADSDEAMFAQSVCKQKLVLTNANNPAQTQELEIWAYNEVKPQDQRRVAAIFVNSNAHLVQNLSFMGPGASLQYLFTQVKGFFVSATPQPVPDWIKNAAISSFVVQPGRQHLLTFYQRSVIKEIFEALNRVHVKPT